jgi:hypothetical protein
VLCGNVQCGIVQVICVEEWSMYKSVYELSREQLDELKETFFYTDYASCKPVGINAETPDEIPDEIIFEWYDGISFVNDDFSCTAGME